MSNDWKWLESTRQLQEEAYGTDFGLLRGHALADYLLVNAYSVSDEISEAMGEFRWKTWDARRGSWVDRDAFVGELVDVAHFLANLACAAGVDDAEWERLYQAKQERNRVRQAAAGGYDAVGSKCPGCKRELDKPAALRFKSALSSAEGSLGVVLCAGCGRRLGISTPGWDIQLDPGIQVPGLSPKSFVCTCEDNGIGKPSVDANCAHCRPALNNGIPL